VWHFGGTSFGAAARCTTTRQLPALQHLLNTSAAAMAMTTASFTLRAARPAPARASAFACGAPPLAIISARRPSQPRRAAAPVTAALPSCSCAAGAVFQSAASTTAAVCATSLVTYLAWGSARAFSLAEVADVLTLRKGVVHAVQQVRARDGTMPRVATLRAAPVGFLQSSRACQMQKPHARHARSDASARDAPRPPLTACTFCRSTRQVNKAASVAGLVLISLAFLPAFSALSNDLLRNALVILASHAAFSTIRYYGTPIVPAITTWSSARGATAVKIGALFLGGFAQQCLAAGYLQFVSRTVLAYGALSLGAAHFLAERADAAGVPRVPPAGIAALALAAAALFSVATGATVL
jgi:hypothetical protein